MGIDAEKFDESKIRGIINNELPPLPLSLRDSPLKKEREELLEKLISIYKQDNKLCIEIVRIIDQNIKAFEDYKEVNEHFRNHLYDEILKLYEEDLKLLPVTIRTKIQKKLMENINESNLDLNLAKRTISLAIAFAKERPPKNELDLFLAGENFLDAAICANQDYLSTPFQSFANGKSPKSYDLVYCQIEKPNGEIETLQDPITLQHLHKGRKLQKNVIFMERDNPKDPKCYQFKKTEPQPPRGKYTYEIEKYYGGKLKNVIYRTNHGFCHSMRVAAIVPMIHSFLKQHGTDYYTDSRGIRAFKEKDLKRVQLMMLYSVVGREDEMGFGDSISSGNYAYQRYRSVSALAFLEYCKEYRKDIYDLSTKEGKEKLYHDALMVELMGYQLGEEFPDVLNPPPLGRPPFKIIEIMQEDIRNEIMNGEEVQALINAQKGTPEFQRYIEDVLNPVVDQKVREKIYEIFPIGTRDAHLDLVNKAHSYDLIRCFAPTKMEYSEEAGKLVEEDWMYSDLYGLIQVTAIGANRAKSSASAEALKAIIEFFQYVNNLLSATGDSHLTTVEMNKAKIDLILKKFIKEEKGLKNSPNYQKDLQEKALALLKEFRFLREGRYGLTEKAFELFHFKTDHFDPTQRDYAREVVSVAERINQTPKPTFYKGVEKGVELRPEGAIDKGNGPVPTFGSWDDYILADLKKMQKFATKRYEELSKTDTGLLKLIHRYGAHKIRESQKDYLDIVLKNATDMFENAKTSEEKEKAYWLILQAADIVEHSMATHKQSKWFRTDSKSRLQTIIEEIRNTISVGDERFKDPKIKEEALKLAKSLVTSVPRKTFMKEFQKHLTGYKAESKLKQGMKYSTYDISRKKPKKTD